MDPLFTTSIIICVFLSLVPWIRRRPSSQAHKLPYPPGPPRLPLIGNALANPVAEAQPYKNWIGIYGPIAYFRLLNQDVIVLNTREAAYELLDKRSSIYVDRPRQVMCGELMSWNRGIALCPTGPRHRTYRKLINRTLSASATRTLWPLQIRDAHTFLADLLFHHCIDPLNTKPKTGYEFLSILRRSIGMNVVGIIFGAECDTNNSQSVGMSKQDMEHYIERADHAQALFSKALVPFAYLVDWLPWLKLIPESLPFATFKKAAKYAREDLMNLTMGPYLKTRERIKLGLPQVSYIDSYFTANCNYTAEDEENVAWTAMSAYTGGSDTTISSITTVFLAAALHPEFQSLAQQELDQVISQDRMPLLDDRNELPYVNAFVQECMRRAPVVPLGIPHRAMEDDVLDGYFIPKGATIIANIRGMLNDPAIYANPSMFDPARFLPIDGIPTNPNIKGRAEPEVGSLPFGFGRRICPGLHLANSAVWIYAASLLWAYEVRLIQDSSEPLTWETAKFSDGAILYPLPFKVDLVPRSKRIQELINEVGNKNDY